MNSTIAAAGLTILSLSVLLIGESPAQAIALQTAGQHCAVEAYPIDSPPAEDPEPVCFETIGAVEAYIQSLSSVGRAAASSVIIGTIYENDQYGGVSLTYFAGEGCYGVTYGYPPRCPRVGTARSALQEVPAIAGSLSTPVTRIPVGGLSFALRTAQPWVGPSTTASAQWCFDPQVRPKPQSVVNGARPRALQTSGPPGTTAGFPSRMTQITRFGTIPVGSEVSGSLSVGNAPCSHISVQSRTASSTVALVDFPGSSMACISSY